jgi:hypothetical protein
MAKIPEVIRTHISKDRQCNGQNNRGNQNPNIYRYTIIYSYDLITGTDEDSIINVLFSIDNNLYIYRQ